MIDNKTRYYINADTSVIYYEPDEINYKTIKVGTKLLVYPSLRSHVNEPYEVVVVESTHDYFETKLIYPEGHPTNHRRKFDYSVNWEYHKNRFIIIPVSDGEKLVSDVEKLAEAWRDFINTISKGLWLHEIVDWLNKKLTKHNPS